MKIELEGRFTHEKAQVVTTFEPTALKVALQYFKKGENFVLVTEETPAEEGVEVHELLCVLDTQGMFGGPLISFYDRDGIAFFTKRPHASVSLALHFPEGGVSARDGIGDWSKAFSLSVPEKNVPFTD